MDDQLLLKLITETVSLLQEMPPIAHQDVGSLVGSYNSILEIAKNNHPESSFIRGIASLEKADKYQLQILFTQLRIVLEALQKSSGPTSAGRAQ